MTTHVYEDSMEQEQDIEIPPKPQQWSNALTIAVIKKRLEREEHFDKPGQRSTLWRDILNELKSENIDGIQDLTSDVISQKYRNLLQTYRTIKRKLSTENDVKVNWQYYHIFESVLGPNTDILNHYIHNKSAYINDSTNNKSAGYINDNMNNKKSASYINDNSIFDDDIDNEIINDDIEPNVSPIKTNISNVSGTVASKNIYDAMRKRPTLARYISHKIQMDIKKDKYRIEKENYRKKILLIKERELLLKEKQTEALLNLVKALTTRR